MKLLMHILKANEKLGIDNRKLPLKDISSKLTEEFTEVIEAIAKYSTDKTYKNLVAMVGETFDLIQVCILILWRSHLIAKGIEMPDLIKDVNIQHKDKLAERGWLIETGIQIDVK